jgi:DEAD/DEAH box helicase domain-containing protein
MTNKNTPFSIFEELRHNYLNYMTTRDTFKLSCINEERKDLIESGILYQEPYLEHIPKYKFSGDLKNDINDAELYEFMTYPDSLFPKNDVEPEKSYKLYTHQQQALELKDKHIVVTSGTGSGKTETFLLPVIRNILNESKNWGTHHGLISNNWKNIEKNNMKYQREGENRPAGIRAMILYPLNALVEDQLIRLRKTLDSEQARNFLINNRKGNLIYFGRYTGNTPVAGSYKLKKKVDALKAELNQLEQMMNGTYVDQNEKEVNTGKYFTPALNGSEMYSRWDMQKYPPDIFITNYSMLNIMLMRKIEDPIFEKTKMWLASNQNNKFQLIIDELHSYRGTAGTEIAYLLKIFLNRIGITPDSPQLQILASSASLGNEQESKNFLREFFGCSKNFNIIKGDLIKPTGKTDFNIDINNYQKIKNDNIAEYLKNLFFDSKINKYIAKSVKQLSFETGKSENFFRELISAISVTDIGKNEFPIRAHYLFKNLRGLWACTNPNCTELEDKYKSKDRKIGKIYSEPKVICGCGASVAILK